MADFIKMKDNALNVGIPSLDVQHQNLVDMINELQDGIVSENAYNILMMTCLDIGNYVKLHFAYEETLFKRHGYPNTEGHMREHEKLRNMFTEYQDKFKETHQIGILAIELHDFIRDWLIAHMQKEDRKYVDFFKSKGIK